MFSSGEASRVVQGQRRLLPLVWSPGTLPLGLWCLSWELGAQEASVVPDAGCNGLGSVPCCGGFSVLLPERLRLWGPQWGLSISGGVRASLRGACVVPGRVWPELGWSELRVSFVTLGNTLNLSVCFLPDQTSLRPTVVASEGGPCPGTCIEAPSLTPGAWRSFVEGSAAPGGPPEVHGQPPSRTQEGGGGLADVGSAGWRRRQAGLLWAETGGGI